MSNTSFSKRGVTALYSSRRRKLIPKSVIVKVTERDCLESFTKYLAGECHFAENTVKTFHNDMKNFLEWLGNRITSRLTISDLADYVDWLHKRNFAQTTLARHIASLRLFFGYLQLGAKVG